MVERIVLTGFLRKERDKKVKRGKHWMDEWAISIEEKAGLRPILYWPYHYYVTDMSKMHPTRGTPLIFSFLKAPKLLKDMNDKDPITISVDVEWWDNGLGAYIKNPKFVNKG